MKKLLLLGFLTLLCGSAMAFEILALGTSHTNCQDVHPTKKFTVRLEQLLRADGFDAHVVNAGVDGDKPVAMLNRLAIELNQNTRLVMFEPGPNDKNKPTNIEYSEKILAQLQLRKTPTIYLSDPLIQTNAEAQSTAKKYGAYYYGHWNKDVPADGDPQPFYIRSIGGHMTAQGCGLWAQNIFPLVRQVLIENDIR